MQAPFSSLTVEDGIRLEFLRKIYRCDEDLGEILGCKSSLRGSATGRKCSLDIGHGTSDKLQHKSTISKIKTMTALKPFVDLCGQVAPVASIALCLAPLPTIEKVKKESDVGELPMLPYSSMATNGFLWTTYGLLRNKPSIMIPNTIGFLLGSYYFMNFHRYAPISSPTLPGSKKLHVAVSLTIGAIALALYSSGLPVAVDILGLSAVVLCLILFASPLAALKSVIQTKSSKSIPLPFTLATLVNCFAWLMFGLFDLKDVNVWLPNVVGLTLAVVQLSLKAIYPGPPEPLKGI